MMVCSFRRETQYLDIFLSRTRHNLAMSSLFVARVHCCMGSIFEVLLASCIRRGWFGAMAGAHFFVCGL